MRERMSGAYTSCGVQVLRASDDLRAIEAAGIWVKRHNRGARRELGVRVQVCSTVRMCVRVGQRNNRSQRGIVPPYATMSVMLSVVGYLVHSLSRLPILLWFGVLDFVSGIRTVSHAALRSVRGRTDSCPG